MINIDMLNCLIEVAGLTLSLCIIALGGFILYKVFDYKSYKNIEQIKTEKLLNIYYLIKKLEYVKKPTKQDKILARINKLEEDISLIKTISWEETKEEIKLLKEKYKNENNK